MLSDLLFLIKLIMMHLGVIFFYISFAMGLLNFLDLSYRLIFMWDINKVGKFPFEGSLFFCEVGSHLSIEYKVISCESDV